LEKKYDGDYPNIEDKFWPPIDLYIEDRLKD